jgi:hypothetical protein
VIPETVAIVLRPAIPSALDHRRSVQRHIEEFDDVVDGAPAARGAPDQILVSDIDDAGAGALERVAISTAPCVPRRRR